MLRELDTLPRGLLETDSRGLAALLGGPTLFHLEGARQPALFVSVLTHGNETVGWEALRALLAPRLARFGELRLPRALSLFVANVSAAALGVRHLPGQPDYNRVWPGGDLPEGPEHRLMAQVVETMGSRGCFASIDLHNNTGLNPHYGCVNRLDNGSLHLATLFARTVVYFRRPTGVQSLAMSRLCPSVTLECGKVGEEAGVLHALDLVEAALHLAEVPDHPVAPHDIDLFHTVARVRVAQGLGIGLPPGPADVLLDPGIERLNFRELDSGTLFAQVQGDLAGLPFEVSDEQGAEVGERFFRLQGGEVRLARPAMPSMLTLDLDVIRQDCLGYLMERYNDHVPHGD